MTAEGDVLEDGHVRKQLDVLERPCDAELGDSVWSGAEDALALPCLRGDGERACAARAGPPHG